MPSRFTQILAGKQGLLSGQDNLFKTKKNRRKVANHDRLIFPFSANFTPANKAAHAVEQSELEQSDFVWKSFCRVSALTVSKSSPLFQIMHHSQKIIGASVLSGSSSSRFRESQVSSNVDALILRIAYLDDSRKYYLANSKNLTKKIVFACVCASAQRQDSQGQETMTRVRFFNRFGLRRVTCQHPRKGRCPTMSLLMTH